MSRANGVNPQVFLCLCSGLWLGLRPAPAFAQEDSDAQLATDPPASDAVGSDASPLEADVDTGTELSLPARLPSFDPYAAPSIPKGVVQQIKFAGGRRVDSFVLRSALRLKKVKMLHQQRSKTPWWQLQCRLF